MQNGNKENSSIPTLNIKAMAPNDYDDESTPLVVVSTGPTTPGIKEDTTETTVPIKGTAVKCVAAMVGILAIVSLSSVVGGNDRSKTVAFDFSETALLRSGTACVPKYDPKKDYCFKDNVTPDHYCWWPSDYFPVGDWKGVNAPSGANSGCGTLCTKLNYVIGIEPEEEFYSLCQNYCSQDSTGCFNSLLASVNSD